MINSDSISLDALPHYTDASRKVCMYINERRTEHRPVGADLLMDSHLSALCFFTRARSRSAALSFCKALFLSLLLAAVLVATVASSGSSGADEDASASASVSLWLCSAFCRFTSCTWTATLFLCLSSTLLLQGSLPLFTVDCCPGGEVRITAADENASAALCLCSAFCCFLSWI